LLFLEKRLAELSLRRNTGIRYFSTLMRSFFNIKEIHRMRKKKEIKLKKKTDLKNKCKG